MPFECDYRPVGYSFADLNKAKVTKVLVNKPWIKRLGKNTDKVLGLQPYSTGYERAMDLWRFSYYTMGTDLVDIGLMKFSDIEDGIWFYERRKTDEGGNGKPLTEKAMAIVMKYYDPKNKYIFNWIFGEKGYDASPRAINDRKKTYVNNLRRDYRILSDKIGLEGRITWRSARYTSSTNVMNKGASLKAVQALMDHADQKTTERYVRFNNQGLIRETLEML